MEWGIERDRDTGWGTERETESQGGEIERQREQRQRQRTEQEWKIAVSLQPSYPEWCPRSILRSSAGQVAVKAGRGRLRSTQHGTSIEILARERRAEKGGGKVSFDGSLETDLSLISGALQMFTFIYMMEGDLLCSETPD